MLENHSGGGCLDGESDRLDVGAHQACGGNADDLPFLIEDWAAAVPWVDGRGCPELRDVIVQPRGRADLPGHETRLAAQCSTQWIADRVDGLTHLDRLVDDDRESPGAVRASRDLYQGQVVSRIGGDHAPRE